MRGVDVRGPDSYIGRQICVQNRCCQAFVELKRLFKERTPANRLMDIDEVQAKAKVPRHGRLTHPLITGGIRKRERECDRRVLTAQPGTVSGNGGDTDQIEAAAQENARGTAGEAPVDGQIQKVVEATVSCAGSQSIAGPAGTACQYLLGASCPAVMRIRHPGSTRRTAEKKVSCASGQRWHR